MTKWPLTLRLETGVCEIACFGLGLPYFVLGFLEVLLLLLLFLCARPHIDGFCSLTSICSL